MSLGGSQTTTTQVPKWLEEPAIWNLDRAQQAAVLGYTPYYGPDVAALTPSQTAAMQNTAGAASAFGLAAPSSPTEGMPQTVTSSNGAVGYSSAPIYQDALAALQAAAPGQYAQIQSMFIDPITGVMPAHSQGLIAQPYPNTGLIY